jgi:hypothetical protein
MRENVLPLVDIALFFFLNLTSSSSPLPKRHVTTLKVLDYFWEKMQVLELLTRNPLTKEIYIEKTRFQDPLKVKNNNSNFKLRHFK